MSMLHTAKAGKNETYYIKAGPLVQLVACLTQVPEVPVRPHNFISSSADSRRAVVRYWRKFVHKILLTGNCLGGLSLLRKSVIRLTDHPDMTIAIYRGHKTTTQQQGRYIKAMASTRMETFSCPDISYSLFSTKIMQDW